MRQKVILKLRARHFIGTEFTTPCDCAISKAAKDRFKLEYVSEGVSTLTVGVKGKRYRYSHIAYDFKDFQKDEIKAKLSTNPETVIRSLTLRLRT